MILVLKTYPVYKNSGVAWLGGVPEHWSVVQVRRFFTVQLGKMLQPLPHLLRDRQVRYLKARNVRWFRLDTSEVDVMYVDLEEIKRYGIKLGDLLVCEGGEGGRCALVMGMEHLEPCIIQNALHRVRPRFLSGERASLNHHLQYVLSVVSSRGWFDVLNDKATIAHFTAEKFRALRIPMPSLPEQRAIVRFLDHATDLIECYISAKERLIKLLEEQKQVIIHQTVTGQIDVRTGRPYPVYKDSGVEWLGEVPEHWSVAQVRRFFTVQLGKMLQPLPRLPQDRQVRYLKARNVQWFSLNVSKVDTMYANSEEIKCYGVSLGDLLVCEGGEGGRCALVTDMEHLEPCIIQNALHRVRPRFLSVERASLNHYLQYVLSVVSSRGWFDVLNDKATIAHFTAEKFSSLRIPMPPLPEQHAIARFLAKTEQRTAEHCAAVKRQIDLFCEYRTRLIADVVTGKLDVREAAACLPEGDLLTPATNCQDGMELAARGRSTRP